MSKLVRLLSFIFIAGSLLFISCSNRESKLKEEVVTSSNISDIANQIKNDKNMSNDDIDLFTQGISRLGAIKDSLNNKTVGQVIENQKEYERNLKTVALMSTASRLEMVYSLGITFTKKLMYSQDTVNADGVELMIKNNSGKAIQGVKGQIRIFNTQNQLIKVRYVEWNDFNLEPGKSVMKREFWNHDPNNQYDNYVRENRDLTAIWVPESITFSDGKKLSITQ
jgi:hypothetical protein